MQDTPSRVDGLPASDGLESSFFTPSTRKEQGQCKFIVPKPGKYFMGTQKLFK